MKEKKLQAKDSQPETTKVQAQVVEKINIRCRTCFIVDGYKSDDKTCRHCGSKLFAIDRY